MAPNLPHAPLKPWLPTVHVLPSKDYQRQQQQPSSHYWEWPADTAAVVLTTDHILSNLAQGLSTTEHPTNAAHDDYWAEEGCTTTTTKTSVPQHAGYWDEASHQVHDDYWNMAAPRRYGSASDCPVHYWDERVHHGSNNDYWNFPANTPTTSASYWMPASHERTESDHYWYQPSSRQNDDDNSANYWTWKTAVGSDNYWYQPAWKLQ